MEAEGRFFFFWLENWHEKQVPLGFEVGGLTSSRQRGTHELGRLSGLFGLQQVLGWPLKTSG